MYHPLSRLLTNRNLFSARLATWTSSALLAVLMALALFNDVSRLF